MKVIIIDPKSKEIFDIVSGNGLEDIYSAIGQRGIDVVMLSERIAMYVHDEGLFVPDQVFFDWKGYHHPIGGKAYVCDIDEEGGDIDTSMSVEEVRDRVTWRDDVEYSHMVSEQKDVDHPIFGQVTAFIQTPVFKQKEAK